jgi:hypothetical protein
MRPDRPFVFLSHARADAEQLFDVNDAMNAAGLDLWFERDGHPYIESVPVTLARAISQCDAFAVLLTDSSMKRAWVRWEVEHAISVGKFPIIPILYGTGLEPLIPPFDRLESLDPVELRPASGLIDRLRRVHDVIELNFETRPRTLAPFELTNVADSTSTATVQGAHTRGA